MSRVRITAICVTGAVSIALTAAAGSAILNAIDPGSQSRQVVVHGAPPVPSWPVDDTSQVFHLRTPAPSEHSAERSG